MTESTRQALKNFLAQSFNTLELRDLARKILDSEPSLENLLPPTASASVAEFVEVLLGLLERHGLIDHEFFQTLGDARPRFLSLINQIRDGALARGDVLPSAQHVRRECITIRLEIEPENLSAADIGRLLELMRSISGDACMTIDSIRRGSTIIAVRGDLPALRRLQRAISRDGELGGITVSEVHPTGTQEGLPTSDGETPLDSDGQFEGLHGNSLAMQQLFARLERISQRGEGSCVLISGETGTGKELAVRALHLRSRRRSMPFIAVDCNGLPVALAAEIFRGQGSRPGCFEEASGGTLFLDELSHLSLEAQDILLGILTEGSVTRIGKQAPVRVDAWVIGATNQDLRAMVQVSAFSDALFHQIARTRVWMPSLRERGDDVLLLAKWFLHSLGEADIPRELSADARAALLAYPWPGNVRQLHKVLQRAHSLVDGTIIERADLDLPDVPAGLFDVSRMVHAEAIAAFERHYFANLLSRHHSKAAAVRAAGMTNEGFRLALRRLRLQS
jgi:transcriptional regulator with AAA-type ATPase domain